MNANLAVLHSSKRHDWETPQSLFDSLNKVYDFEIDVCATENNAKVPTYFSPEMDGLAQTWAPRVCWMNPPYGREIGDWMEKAFDESLKGATVVCLVPSRTDTKWWHDYAMQGKVEFIKGRLKFVGAEHCAPFPSALVVFEPCGFDGLMNALVSRKQSD